MLLTRKEADKMYCVRACNELCNTTECMAWRWEGQLVLDTTRDEKDVPAGWEKIEHAEIGTYWREPRAEGVARLRGYCGLAGKPYQVG